MPEFRKVEYAEHQPGACLLCRTTGGPFVDCMTVFPDVATAHGMTKLDGRVYLCTSTDKDRPGCVEIMAREAGLLDHEQTAGLHLDLRLAKEANAILVAELAEAKANRVVPVSELLEIVGGASS